MGMSKGETALGYLDTFFLSAGLHRYVYNMGMIGVCGAVWTRGWVGYTAPVGCFADTRSHSMIIRCSSWAGMEYPKLSITDLEAVQRQHHFPRHVQGVQWHDSSRRHEHLSSSDESIQKYWWYSKS